MTAPEAIDPEPLLRYLHGKGVAHIIIGGVAVAAHGYVRPTKDLDVVPRADQANLMRLAAALAEIDATPAARGDFDADEFPMDATNSHDDLYEALDRDALAFTLDDVPLRYCGLAHLRSMKQAAGRSRDLDDLEHLPPVD